MIDNIATGSEAEADAMMDAFEKANFKDAVDGAVADAGFEKGVENIWLSTPNVALTEVGQC